MKIASIADHPDLIETIAGWHWDEWGHVDPGGSPEVWAENLRRFCNRDRIPTIYVALDGDEPLGAAGLNEHDMSTRQELSPWVSGVIVKPSARGRGVASALVRHAVKQARGMGIARVYLYTGSATALYEKLGWRIIEDDMYNGLPVTIMAIDTTTRSYRWPRVLNWLSGRQTESNRSKKER
jgi:GNAT superfamily N-acetyltransferase